MNEEEYEWFDVTPPFSHSIVTKKYIYEGKARTTKYIRVDGLVCCPPVFKQRTDMTLLTRQYHRETSKYSPQGDKQQWRNKNV